MRKPSRTWLTIVAPLALIGCPPTSSLPEGLGSDPASHEQAQDQLGSVSTGAGEALDPAQCEKGDNRLRPFVVSWDTTTQAEFAAMSQESLLVVAATGCELRLLPQCKVPGEYRARATPGGFQSLTVQSRGELYGKLSFSVVELAGHVGGDKSLALEYFVGGIHTATAPGLFLDDLPEGCRGATHFVLNFSTGAFQLASKASREAGASGDVATLGGAGTNGKESASVLYRGGDLTACKDRAFECTAPVRLRLLPIAEGHGDAYQKRALTTPAPAATEHNMNRREIAKVLNSGKPSVQVCSREHAGTAGAKMNLRFVVGADGVVKKVTVQGAEQPGDLVNCVTEVMYGLRFPPTNRDVTVLYPYVL